MSQAAADPVVALRCSLDYPDIETFIVRYGRNLSTRGIFLPSADPPPAGTAVRFEVVLADGRPILRGEGPVAKERMKARREAWDNGDWVREAAAAHEEKRRARKAA